DIAFGDAWLPQYVKASLGTNVVTVRRGWINELLSKAHQRNDIQLEAISSEEVERSQDAGLRHRREGLQYRLERAKRLGLRTPSKRQSVQKNLGELEQHRAQTYECRELLRESSHTAFSIARAQNDFSVFENIMQPLVANYQQHLNSQRQISWIGRRKRQLGALKKRGIRQIKHWLGRDCRPIYVNKITLWIYDIPCLHNAR